MDITPFLTTFGLIAIAELGDKTQLTVIALSAGFERVKVFLGVVLAFILVTALGVLAGNVIINVINPDAIKILAGLMFVIFGLWTLRSRQSCEEDKVTAITSPLISTFSMIFLAEMGDKTQLSAITLAAKYNSPFLVFSGAVLALVFLSLIGIIIGNKMCELIPLSKIKFGAGIIFIIFGLSFLAEFMIR